MSDFLCSWKDWNSNDVDCVSDQEIPTKALAAILLNRVRCINRNPSCPIGGTTLDYIIWSFVDTL